MTFIFLFLNQEIIFAESPYTLEYCCSDFFPAESSFMGPGYIAFEGFSFGGLNFGGFSLWGFNCGGISFGGLNFEGFNFRGFNLVGFNFGGFSFGRFYFARFNFGDSVSEDLTSEDSNSKDSTLKDFNVRRILLWRVKGWKIPFSRILLLDFLQTIIFLLPFRFRILLSLSEHKRTNSICLYTENYWTRIFGAE